MISHGSVRNHERHGKGYAFSNLAANSETPHHLFDLNLDLISDLRVRHKDYKSLDSGNAIAFTSNVLNLDIVLLSDFYGRRGAI
jgi:hypothetical protein